MHFLNKYKFGKTAKRQSTNDDQVSGVIPTAAPAVQQAQNVSGPSVEQAPTPTPSSSTSSLFEGSVPIGANVPMEALQARVYHKEKAMGEAQATILAPKSAEKGGESCGNLSSFHRGPLHVIDSMGAASPLPSS